MARQLFGGRPVMVFRDEMDRRRFLRGAALIGVGGSLAYVTKRDPVAFGQDAMGDLDILNYALTLEYLEATFYQQALANNILEGRELELVAPIADHEAAHVEALTATIADLGGTPVEQPQFNLPQEALTQREAFLTNASTFEELGVDAYHGQITRISSAEILAAAAAIAGVESRHAAILAQITGGDPFPAPVEDNLPMDAVLQQVQPLIAG